MEFRNWSSVDFFCNPKTFRAIFVLWPHVVRFQIDDVYTDTDATFDVQSYGAWWAFAQLYPTVIIRNMRMVNVYGKIKIKQTKKLQWEKLSRRHTFLEGVA